MKPLKEIGECLITAGETDFFFRPSFINMTRIGGPEEIVQVFYDLYNDEVSGLIQRAVDAYGHVPAWLIKHISESTYGRKAFLAAISVLDACCDEDISALTGVIHPAKGAGKPFKYRRGAMSEFDMLVIAQSLITHGIIGKAKVRKLQRNESNQKTTTFNAFEYISSARNHLGLPRSEAENLTMTEFALMIQEKFPDQKGYTREEYDQEADDYFARRKRRLAKDKLH